MKHKPNWPYLLDSATDREKQNIEITLRRIWQKYHPKPEVIQARQEQNYADRTDTTTA